LGDRYDVVIVGGGNAAFSAAHAARERVERVLVLEKAPREWAGGNSYFTAGAYRTTFEGLEDLKPLLDNPDEELLKRTELEPYAPENFMADMERLTEGQCDRDLTSVLVNDAADTIRWLHGKGLRFRLMHDRQSYEVDGKRRFWGGLVLGTVDGGKGLIEQHTKSATGSGIEIRYESPVVDLIQERDGSVVGVVCETSGGREEVRAGAVVLAAGGFESDEEMRAEHLGEQWRAAKVRGTPHNTGDALRINYTYARYGAEILRQPGALAYQLFDGKTRPLLRQDEYTAPGVSRYEADTISELANKAGINAEALERTVEEYNAAIRPGAFNPAVKDSKHTEGIEPPKSNWALPLDTPPYLAFAVTCGITFTFGGLHIDQDGRVLDSEGNPIPGLHAAGELVGGLFYHNYPGGSGLMAGSVFGRRAGRVAAEYAALQREVRGG
jgi:tricarballylate dehydrogenase